jgi:hypothetical protein
MIFPIHVSKSVSCSLGAPATWPTPTDHADRTITSVAPAIPEQFTLRATRGSLQTISRRVPVQLKLRQRPVGYWPPTGQEAEGSGRDDEWGLRV